MSGSMMKPEASPYNTNSYGSSFTSQRTSLESGSERDYSVYGGLSAGGLSSHNSSSFISQDGTDFVPKTQTPISRSFSGYTQPALSESYKQSRSFSGFSADSLSDPHTLMPKNEQYGQYGQFMGFGAIGSQGLSNVPYGTKSGSTNYERMLDSYSSEDTTVDGMDIYQMQNQMGNTNTNSNNLRVQSQYRENEYNDPTLSQSQSLPQTQAQAQAAARKRLQSLYLDEGDSPFETSPSQERERERERERLRLCDTHGEVDRPLSRSSSFGSTLDSLSSYKHLQGDTDKKDHRRGGFVMRDAYGNINTDTTFRMTQTAKVFEPMPSPHNTHNTHTHNTHTNTNTNRFINSNIALQDVKESLEEDRDSDERRSYSPITPFGREINLGLNLGVGGEEISDYNNNNNNSNLDYTTTTNTATGTTVSTGVTSDVLGTYVRTNALSVSSPSSATTLVDSNESSNIDSVTGFQLPLLLTSGSNSHYNNNDSNSNSNSNSMFHNNSGSSGKSNNSNSNSSSNNNSNNNANYDGGDSTNINSNINTNINTNVSTYATVLQAEMNVPCSASHSQPNLPNLISPHEYDRLFLLNSQHTQSQ